MEYKSVDSVLIQKESKTIKVDRQELLGEISHEGLEDLQRNKENGYSTLSRSGFSLDICKESSLTDLACKEVPNLEMACQSLSTLKDGKFKENRLINLKAQKFSKSMAAEDPNNYSFVHAMRSFEDDGFGYDSSHDSGRTSSFELHKGNREYRRSVLGLFSKSVPSKWDDAEKWLVNNSCATVHVKKKEKPLVDQMLNIPTQSSRKVSDASQSGHRSSIKKAASLNTSMILFDHMTAKGSLNKDIGETKKITSEFSFMEANSHTIVRIPKDSVDCHPLKDVFSQNPQNQKEINNNHAFFTASLQSEKAISVQTTLSSKHDPATYVQSAVLYIPPPSNIKQVPMRDMGTEMTPIASKEPSRTGTPIRATSPMIQSPVLSQPSTPGRGGLASLVVEATEGELAHKEKVRNVFLVKDLQTKSSQDIMVPGAQSRKANISGWTSKEEEEYDASTSLNIIDLEEAKRHIWEARASSWEEAERAKNIARYKQEEAKIQAWEIHQKAKAESEMRRIEVKVERMKSHAQEKLLYKLAALQQNAEQKRVAAQATQLGHTAKITQRADYIRRTGRIPTLFFCCRFCF